MWSRLRKAAYAKVVLLVLVYLGAATWASHFPEDKAPAAQLWSQSIGSAASKNPYVFYQRTMGFGQPAPTDLVPAASVRQQQLRSNAFWAMIVAIIYAGGFLIFDFMKLIRVATSESEFYRKERSNSDR